MTLPPSPPQIRELPEHVVHKIAAGEVVERPVSVVKELVENALDAGATRIEVDIKKGGMESIVVSDNGHGIPPQQMPLALKRHATSKITQAEDLFSIETLGFRGEALASMASVSEFRLESATEAEAPLGYALEVKQGRVGNLQELSMPRGTRVKVEKLFCTTPARLKFLKKPETEWSHIADMLTALALSRLDVEWRITHNGKPFLFCPVTDDPKKRFLDLFGRELAGQLYPVEREVAEVGVWGLLGHPNYSKKTNRMMFVYVNGRYVQDRVLNHAIVQGYRSMLMTQQYPVILLHLNLAPALVDVNVHPTKREIKFANGQAIHHLVSETIHQALSQAPWSSPSQTQVSSTSPVVTLRERQEPWPLPSSAKSKNGEDEISPGKIYQGGVPRPSYADAEVAKARVGQALEAFQERLFKTPQTQEAKVGTLSFADLRLLGQFLGTYLVCEQGDSLVLIDQHAAHERIGFEKFKASFAKGSLPTQAFLTPPTFDLSPQEAARLRPCLEELERFGLEVEDFGEDTFVLKRHPTLLKNCDWQVLLEELAEQIELHSQTQVLAERIDHLLATMACHRQIRAHHKLTHEEMEALLKDLEGTPRAYHCPHGRPVMVEIEAKQIEKWFKRVL